MDYVSSMFPLQQSDDPLYHFSSNLNQDHKIQQDLLTIIPSFEAKELPIAPERSRSRRRSSADLDDKDERTTNDNNSNRKIIHRDVVQQRRQEMAGLYESLRSLLSLEYLKGKRTLPDRINAATNYIEDLKKKIKELGEKRNELKRLSNLSSLSVASASSQNRSPLDYSVTVRPCLAGVEVLISSGFRGEELPLSRVIEALVDEGMNLISCISTKSNEKSLHTIQSEVSNLASIDLLRLQQKLTDLVRSSTYTAMI